MKKSFILLILTLSIIDLMDLYGATKTWNKTTGGLWTTANNWTPSGAPLSNDIIIINTDQSANITAVPSISINSLQISGNCTLVGASTNRVLTVGGITGVDFSISQDKTFTIGSNLGITLAGSATATIDGTLNITSGRTYNTNGTSVITTVNGSINNAGTVTNSTAAKLLFQNGSEYIHARNGGAIPTATWDVASTCNITGITGSVPTTSTFNQAFGNFIWNCTSQSSNITLAANLKTINGNFTISSTNSSLLILSAGTATTLTVGKDFTMTDGTLNFNSGTGASAMNVAGNFSHTGGTITETSSGTGSVVFNGSSDQIYTSGGSYANTINLSVNNGATLLMNDESTVVGSGSNGTFTLNNNGTLGVTSIDGITTSGATGNIRVTGTRTYSTGANYIYNGINIQVTGNGLTQNSPADLTISNAAGVSLSTATTISGNLTLNEGTLSTTTVNPSYLLNVTNTSNTAISGGSASSFIDGAVQWNLPTLASGTTYQFPVGKGGTYLPFSLVNPTTTGASSAKVEAFNSNSGGTADETTLQSISSTEYWSLVTGSNFTNSSVTLGKSTAIYPSDAVGAGTSAGGTYTSLSGTTNINSISNSTSIGAMRYFTLASRTNYWVGSISNDWNTTGNWSVGHVPASGQNIEFADGNNYGTIAQNDLHITSDLTINKLKNVTSKALVIFPGKTLTVNSTITTSNNTNQIYIKADTLLANGSLIYQTTQPTPVYGTVEMWSQSGWDTNQPAGQKYNWQYFGIPIDTVKASPTVNGAYIRYMDEAGNDTTTHWHSLTNTSNIIPFKGYELCFQTPRIISFNGKFVNRNFNSGQLSKTTTEGVLYAGQHILANPYTAAIDIRQITFGSDMEQSVYLYNTGTFAQWNSGTAGKIGSTPGQYSAVPQLLAGESGIQSQVPSMNSMLVRVINSTPNAFVNINYNSVITGNTERQRIKSATNGSSKYVSTRIEVESKNGIDKLWLFADEQLSRKYDNGYDAKKMTGSSLQQQIFAVEDDGEYQIDATDNLNNTKIAFQAGQEQDYKMTFYQTNIDKKYSGLYLFDMVENKTTEITESGSVYNFKANPTPKAVTRFRIIATPVVSDKEPEANIVYFNINNTLYLYNRANETANIYLFDISGRVLNRTTIPASGMTGLLMNPEKVIILRSVYSSSSESHKIMIR